MTGWYIALLYTLTGMLWLTLLIILRAPKPVPPALSTFLGWWLVSVVIVIPVGFVMALLDILS